MNEHCLDQVSGLYGPGSILAWYLTLLGCLVSWTFHPSQWKEDTISADMVAVLLLPLAAASHLISLARSAKANDVRYQDPSLLSTCQTVQSLAAPLRIVSSWFIISILLILPHPAIHHPKRGCAIALVLIVCLITNFYTYDRALIGIPPFHKASAYITDNQAVNPINVCFNMIGYDAVIFVLYLRSFRLSPTGSKALEDQTQTQTQTQTQGSSNSNSNTSPPRNPFYSKLITHIYLNHIVHLTWGVIVYYTPLKGRWWWLTGMDVSPKALKGMIPQTSLELGNMEQIMAAMGGVVLLVWDLWDVGRGCWEIREGQRKEIEEERVRLEGEKSGVRGHGKGVEG